MRIDLVCRFNYRTLVAPEQAPARVADTVRYQHGCFALYTSPFEQSWGGICKRCALTALS
jgi:hypothetical protein